VQTGDEANCDPGLAADDCPKRGWPEHQASRNHPRQAIRPIEENATTEAAGDILENCNLTQNLLL
jgi:hypothetical protein